MQAQHGHSAACCNIPPIIAKDYKMKGKYETLGGVKTYVTGPSNASSAILFIYDIFGYFPQTLQGADILASCDKDHQYQVFMPDFFEGTPCDIAWYPPTDETKQKKLGEWFKAHGAFDTGASKVPGYLKEFEKYNSNIKKWGVAGFCWGGKVISLTCQSDTPWTAAATSSPAQVDPSEAEKITIPFCMLPSKDEPAEDMKKFEAALKTEKYIETFDTQVHGWMTARGNLEDEQCKKEYERGYKTFLEFFAKYL